MDVKKILNEYKEKKSKLDIRLSTIEAWQEAIKKPQSIVYLVQTSAKELGMPKGSFNISSPVEREILNKIEDAEEAIKLLKEWIAEEESRAFPLRIFCIRIEHALNALASDERYIIECKHFEGLIWRDIEINYNKKYRNNNNYIGTDALRKIYKSIIKKLERILAPYYA
ncbi:MAG: hypothetical protein FH761_16675 [Firmicutes bacterium]|nr:hypothetical protein [Bacillota bacterium]